MGCIGLCLMVVRLVMCFSYASLFPFNCLLLRSSFFVSSAPLSLTWKLSANCIQIRSDKPISIEVAPRNVWFNFDTNSVPSLALHAGTDGANSAPLTVTTPSHPNHLSCSNKAIESHKTPLSDKNPPIHRTLSESDIESYWGGYCV